MSSGAGRKIVVVEDEPAIREIVEQMLRMAGYHVAGTGDSTLAVDLVRKEDPDLVLCDIAMPELDGYGVLRALQSDPATAHYPVVFLTANREFSERVQAFRYGVVDYITKPFARDSLLHKIGRVLQEREQRSGSNAQRGVGSLLDELHREARSGFLSLRGSTPARLVLQAGEVVEGGAAEESAEGDFHELDPAVEVIVSPLKSGATAPETASLDSLPAAVKTVLVVDDNPAFRAFLRDLLVQEGFTVHEAEGGETALAVALESRPWLILTDVNMPDVDGFELCRRVRAHGLIRHTPLIFLSGWDDHRERYHGLEAGGNEFLSKETPVRDLLARIRGVLHRYARFTDPEPPASGRPPAIEGRLELIGPSSALQMCHLGKLSGTFVVRSEDHLLEIRFRAGEIVGARTADAEGVGVVHELLALNHGRFEFSPGPPGEGEPLGQSLEHLLLEGARILDERRRSSEG